jgi:GDP-L-fucose synthase
MQEDYDALRNDLKHYAVGCSLDADIIHDETMICSLLIRYGIRKNSVTLWGTGTPYREFLYVDDVARAALFLAESYGYRDIGECINVGTGIDCSIRELATIISSVVGYSGEIFYDATKPDGTLRKLLDVTRLRDLGWGSRMTLADGVRVVYAWYSNAQKVGSNEYVETAHQSFETER